MEVKVLEEHGYQNALRGMAYSHFDNAKAVEDWWVEQFPKSEKRAAKLAPMEGGHNKFLESICVWVDIEASRAFWSEFDTYRVGITKQSTSTMHRLSKRKPTKEDFEEGTTEDTIRAFQFVWCDHTHDINILKMNLPEGYLQRRVVCTNYKCLKNIIEQRSGHRLRWWDVFIDELMKQIEHPELLVS